MGSSNSKEQKKDSGKDDCKRAKTDSPNSEKHNSADSQAPLAQHAASFVFPPTPTLDRHMSVGDTAGDTECIPSTSCENEKWMSVTSTELDSHHVARARSVQVHELEGHSNVSRPPPPPSLRRLSELIDPAELTIDSHIRSPSGNLLAPEQFLVHPYRPRSIRERQEQIREKVRAASRLGIEAETVTEDEKPSKKKDGSKKKVKRGYLSCFGCLGC